MSREVVLRTSILFSLVLAAAAPGAASLAGCGGTDSTPPPAVDPATVCFDYTGFSAGAPVSFKTDVLPILRRSCGISSSCHGSMNSGFPNQPFLGPSLSSDPPTVSDVAGIFTTLYAKSDENPTMPRVAPGDPSNSFLMYKLDGQIECSKLACAKKTVCDKPPCDGGSVACGTGMPQSGVFIALPSSDRDLVRRWIKQGAVNDDT